MKIKEIEQLTASGTSYATGRFQSYKEETSPKAGTYGKTTILIGSALCEFPEFAPKVAAGVAPQPVKRPDYAKEYGTPVILIGYSAKLDGKYLRHSAESIHAIEK